MADYAGNDTFPASADLVDDGTVRDAASVNVAAEAALDRTTYLRNVGFRRFSIYESNSSAGTWTFDSAHPNYGPTDDNPTTDWLVTIADTRVGDVIQLDLFCAADVDAATTVEFRIGATDNFGGGGTEVLTYGRREASGTGGALTSNNLIVISTVHVVVSAGTTRIRLLGRVSGAGSALVRYGGNLRAILLRPTGSFV